MVISVIAFSIIVSVGIFLLFKSSIQRDTEHIRFVALSGDVEKEILKARIYIDDIILNNDNTLLSSFQRSIDSVRRDLKEIYSLFEREAGENSKLELASFREYHAKSMQNLDQIEQGLDQSAGIARSDTVLFNSFNSLLLNYQELKTFLPEYLIMDTIQYKREIMVVILINFAIILLGGFFILKLVNQLIRADRRLVTKTIEVENRERERIAADLHDGLGSLLSGLIIHIQVMEKENRDNTRLSEQLKTLNAFSNQALMSIEEVINNLNPSTLTRYGLVKSLERNAERINQLGKTRFSIKADDLTSELEPSLELFLYRICFELINNALKHSSAKEAELLFYNQKKKIYMEYRDNGIGFNMDSAFRDAEKTGLSNLIRRVESLEGNYQINSEPGKGVHIKIMFKSG